VRILLSLKCKPIIPVMILCAFFIQTAHSQVIIQENFDGPITQDLGNSTSNAWITAFNRAGGGPDNNAASIFRANGRIDKVANGTGAQHDAGALLPIPGGLEADRIYTLSATFNNNNANWSALGFAADDTVLDGSSGRHSDSSGVFGGYAWVLTSNRTGNNQEIFGGIGTNGNFRGGDLVNSTQAVTIRIVLNTTDTTAVTAEYFLNDVSQGSQTLDASAFADIQFVGISSDGGSAANNPSPAAVDDFLLTSVSASDAVGASTQIAFDDVTDVKNLGNFRGYSGDLHGCGGIFTDLNNDGYADLYLTNNDGASDYSKLYLNVADANGGRTFSLQTNGTFSGATGAIAADYDNDGDVDIYVTNMSGTNRLYQNQLSDTGVLGFTDVTSVAGVSGINNLARQDGNPNNNSDDSLAACWFDPDRDGDLDLYVGNHNDGSDPSPFDGAADTFYLNNGDGTFTDATALHNLSGFEDSNGNNNNFSDTNAVVTGDLNNDGWIDLLVTNKSGFVNTDQVYINQGADANGNWLGYNSETFNGNFDNSFAEIASNGNSLITRSAMGANIADVDGDGDLDIFISDNPESAFSGNVGSSNLFINQFAQTGTLSFEHGQVDTGLSWGVQIEDFDNDGDLEVHSTNDTVVNGGNAALLEFIDNSQPLRVKTNQDENNPLFEGFANNPIPVGDTIADVIDVSISAGANNFGGNGRGSLTADYNRDGKLDLFLININNDFRESQLNQPPVLLENTSSSDNSFLNVKLIGDPNDPNDLGFATSRDAIGSRVEVVADIDGDGVDETLIREVASGTSNATSTSSLELEFGLGEATEAQVNVIWADGRTNDLGVMPVDQFVVVDQESFSVLLGDVNRDGVVDFFDISPFIVLLSSGEFQAEADVDQSGFVNFFDISPFIIILSGGS